MNSYPHSFEFNWSDTHFNRIALINLLLSKYSKPSYLEIGCASNSLFDSLPIVNKIGVDPHLGGNRRMTSNEFFKINTKIYDVVFIDGLHTYEQVRQDLTNALKVTKAGGWIAIHDMLPKDWIECHIPIISTGSWTGDVWKLGFELTNSKIFDFKIIKIDMGIGLIKVTDRNLRLKNDMPELKVANFEYLYMNFDKLPVIEWDKAKKWIDNA